ncbi:MAG: M28 family peptidase [Candidatus Aminicenantes bacterium]|nr:MAG: M28 family peptidase [Candidatus Aminicenantes bacterium]
MIVLFAFLLLTSCAVGFKKEVKISDEEKTQMDRLLDSISGEKLLGYVKKLSSKTYAGRLTGTPEFRACANWVGSLFEEWNLAPRGDNDTYFQAYPNPYTIIFVGGELSYTYQSRGQKRKKKYAYEKEYFPGSQSANGSVTAEVVYVGYGITAPELYYDDYAGVNVKEKIVLVEPGAPVSPESDPALFKDWRPYSFNQYKLKMAVAHGAKGILFSDLTVNPDIDHVPRLMVAQVGESVVKDLFAGSGKTHQENLEEIQSSLQPRSFRTRKVFTIQNFTEHHSKGIGYNVIGQIEGIDPLLKQEVIILGANLDHLGFCYEIMPGANDNASGVAVLLGAVEALAKSPVRPKRSVLFIAFGSKEQAFMGAQTYLKKPVFPKNKTIVYLNLSTVGGGDKARALGAQNYPELWAYISQAADEPLQHVLEPFPYSNLGRPRLDSDLFIGKGIPSITFTVYGAPTFARTRKDTADTINPGTMEQLSKILYRGVLSMANSGQDFFEKK